MDATTANDPDNSNSFMKISMYYEGHKEGCEAKSSFN
jgi:hypothetical protein